MDKPLFQYTGNPIIDNGIAVIAMFCQKEKYCDITEESIKQNIDDFFESIEDQYDDPDASKEEKIFTKKKLKQHFTGLYVNNHYLFGVNNAYLRQYNSKTKKIESIRKIKESKDFFDNLKNEVLELLKNSGHSYILSKKDRLVKQGICKFCGKKADVLISSDILPMTSALDDFNLGTIQSCRYCYIATLFYFFNMIALKKSKDDKGQGIFFFYHFSQEELMIELAKRQYNHLKQQPLASLETTCGERYKAAFDHVHKLTFALKNIEKKLKNIFATIYFMRTDNRGTFYNKVSVPKGVFSFWYKLNNPELQGEWVRLTKQFNKERYYQDFISGMLDISFFRYSNIKTLKAYLKEVKLMEKDKIDACEDLAKNLIQYYKDKPLQKRDHWVKELCDLFALKEGHAFFNDLLNMNNEYFRLSGGQNLIEPDALRLFFESHKEYRLLFRIVEYFYLNSLSKEEKEILTNYYSKKKNIKERN